MILPIKSNTLKLYSHSIINVTKLLIDSTFENSTKIPFLIDFKVLLNVITFLPIYFCFTGIQYVYCEHSNLFNIMEQNKLWK